MNKYFILFFACLSTFPSYLFGQTGQLQDVVIKGQEILNLKSTKPKLEIPIEQDKEILKNLETEDEIFFKKPTGWEKQPHDSMPLTVKSPQVVVPRTHHIKSEKVTTFYPLAILESVFREPDKREAKKLANWELIVADDSGQIFRSYSGQGLPPEEISFNGRNDNNKVLEVGYSYSTILRYTDAKGSLHTSVGNPFIVAGFAHQEPKGFYISLDIKDIFINEPSVFGNIEFNTYGNTLLQEAADLIKTKFFAMPVQVVIYGKNKQISQKIARGISEKFTKLLIRNDSEISFRGEVLEKSLEHAEIIIMNQ